MATPKYNTWLDRAVSSSGGHHEERELYGTQLRALDYVIGGAHGSAQPRRAQRNSGSEGEQHEARGLPLGKGARRRRRREHDGRRGGGDACRAWQRVERLDHRVGRGDDAEDCQTGRSRRAGGLGCRGRGAVEAEARGVVEAGGGPARAAHRRPAS